DCSLAASGIKVRFERKQAVKSCLRPIALVLVSTDLLLAYYRIGFLIQNRLRDFHGGDLFMEETFPLSAGGALLAEERVLILRLPANLVAFGHDFRSVAHDHVQTGQLFQQAGIGV